MQIRDKDTSYIEWCEYVQIKHFKKNYVSHCNQLQGFTRILITYIQSNPQSVGPSQRGRNCLAKTKLFNFLSSWMLHRWSNTKNNWKTAQNKLESFACKAVIDSPLTLKCRRNYLCVNQKTTAFQTEHKQMLGKQEMYITNKFFFQVILWKRLHSFNWLYLSIHPPVSSLCVYVDIPMCTSVVWSQDIDWGLYYGLIWCIV